ncbi:F-box/LRR-repeat protein At3g26922-like [Cornus florida]|uniref:F-box/LRR-repeat protein At3g26922-like n=1 Tax=Cornus florida TaxID=4283 RepID=UPI0028A07B47|nr:F-box/LRR-repeat protein At3g26922-like [Cornus florida]
MIGKKKRKVRIELIDRISDLPDSIVGLILSFLPTEDAIRTSLLSKRWRLAWTSLPSLYFRFDSTKSKHIINDDSSSFAWFVHRALTLRQRSPIDSFRFSAHLVVDATLIEECIRYAIQHNVKELKLRVLSKPRPVRIDSGMLSLCRSLTVLKLTCGIRDIIVLPKTLGLPVLRRLHMKNFVFSEKNYNGDFFSSCPNLEILVLCKCMMSPPIELKVLNIHVPQLKELEILHWRCPWVHFYEQSISVSAPRLTRLKYEGLITPLCFKQEMSCLDRVCIDLCCPGSCVTVNELERKRKTAEKLIAMLGELSSVRSLTLSLKTVEILSSIYKLEERESCIFCNLRYLAIKAEDKRTEKTIPINAITYLLQSSASKKLSVGFPRHHPE